MKQTYHFSAIVLAIIVGCIFVLGLGYISGSFYATSRLPVMAVISGFIITGILVGWVTKEETIIEPGIASLVVALVSYFVFRAWDLKGFADLSKSDLVLMLCNGLLVAFAGAWAGELLQSSKEEKKSLSIKLEWPWIVCGASVGLTLSIVLVSSVVILLGADYTYMLIAFAVGLLLTGFLVGWRSPGATLFESAFAGFLTVILSIDIVILTLTSVPAKMKFIGLSAGIVISLIGGFLGEAMQKVGEKKK